MVRYGENDCYTRLVPFLKSKPKPHPGGDTCWKTAATSGHSNASHSANTRAIRFKHIFRKDTYTAYLSSAHPHRPSCSYVCLIIGWLAGWLAGCLSICLFIPRSISACLSTDVCVFACRFDFVPVLVCSCVISCPLSLS